MKGRLCTLFYVILYKGLEHPWVLLSMGAGGPRANPLWENIDHPENTVLFLELGFLPSTHPPLWFL